MIWARPIPCASIVSIRSRIGTEKLQLGWLQLATVRPHPHWQVSASAISWRLGAAACAARSGSISGTAITTASAIAASAVTSVASANLVVTFTGSVSSGHGFGIERLIAAERNGQRGALAHVGPHHDNRADRHHQAARP